MKKICIDFQGGAHGNFLEFVCNTVAGVNHNNNPFNSYGASHNKLYYSEQIFYANHYSFGVGTLDSDKIVAIKIEIDDLLPLSLISLLRAGDHNYDSDKLEIDTYNKFNNENYKWVLDTLINSFFTNQIENSYNQVKDPSWPEVHSLEDFEKLPGWIKQECLEVHDLKLFEFNEQHPDCPRNILREFFQIGFANPHQAGFITQQQNMKYPDSCDVYDFPFNTFYNTESFINQIKNVASWAGFCYTSWENIVDLHCQFLERQPYKDSKIKCDQLIQQIINGNELPTVNLLEEAYINAMLEKSGHERRY